MKTQTYFRGLPLLLLGLLLAGGCTELPNRGEFGATSCESGQRMSVYADAAYAIYVDANGNPLGTRAEVLKGTQEDEMCPTQEPSGPGACPAGSCPRTLSGKTYCLKC